VNQLADSLEQGNGVGPLIVSLTPRGAPPPSAEQIGALNKALLSSNDPLALAAATRGTSALQPAEAILRSNRVPVLAVAGELDPRRTEVERLAEITPNLKVALIPAANHLTAFSNPEFLKCLKAFLAGHPKK
jgi:pimeloyl-ACP methyl ester carboxylesterase